jgi:hypothetical protein
LSTKPRPAFSWNQVDALRAEANLIGDDVPDGAFNAYDYMSKYGVPYKTAAGQLDHLVRAGKMKTGKRLDSSRGRRQLIRFYWPV